MGLGSLAVASVASGLISGPLSDRYGRKPVMLTALAGSSVAFCAFALVEGFTGYLLVSVAAGLAGNSTFDAARTRWSPTSPRRSGGPGLTAWSASAATSGGAWPAGGRSVRSLRRLGADLRDAFLGASALVGLVALVVALAVEESLPAVSERAPLMGASRLRAAFADGPFVALLAAGVLLYYVFTQDWQALPIYAKNFLGVEDGRIGLFLGANGPWSSCSSSRSPTP